MCYQLSTTQEVPYIIAMLSSQAKSKTHGENPEYNKVIIALDPDGIGKTVEYRRDRVMGVRPML